MDPASLPSLSLFSSQELDALLHLQVDKGEGYNHKRRDIIEKRVNLTLQVLEEVSR